MIDMFDQLKPLIQNGERYIVVEGGRPEYVLMRFHDYVSLAGSRRGSSGGNPGYTSGEWERANVELGEVRVPPLEHEFRAEFATEPIVPAADPTTIRLEDLPL
jgi:hypothetical protein